MRQATDGGARNPEGGTRKMDFISSNSQMLLEKSMGFLWTKQAAHLDNISNVETPNYKKKTVTFEESLRDKLNKAAASPTNTESKVRKVLESSDFAVTDSDEDTRMDDNGVNITEESVELARNAYQIQYVMQSINNRLSILRTAISG
jgi:flagellar basal-body rod protein FlgB